MVVSKTFRAAACASCRFSILRSFTSLAGPSIRVPQVSARGSRCSNSSSPSLGLSSRHLSNGQKLDSSHAKDKDVLEVEAPELEDLEGNEGGDNADLETGDVTAVPWYLQVESPNRIPKPLSERQSLPDLPDSPPPILQPLLQQISIDLGLDDLSLLDLRKLDPPPALGANLLMILGTARSEKHLHVSADRLCRWLRSNYRLRPDADGLLGRNELKLKMKRKAKRAKLMGSANDETGDDGVRTGWVCVDIGVVDGAEPATAATAPQDHFIGFGRRTDGVRIVVQMLTEEKREEIELEKLWTDLLKRGSEPETDLVDTEPQDPASHPGSPRLIERTSPAATLGRGQIRGFHTVTRFVAVDTPIGEEAMKESFIDAIMSTQYDLAVDILRKLKSRAGFLQQGEWKLLLLEHMRSYLEQVPCEHAIEQLGIYDSYIASSPYLTCFRGLCSSVPTETEAEIRIWLACFAGDLGHPQYSRNRLFKLFKELQIFGTKISLGSYMLLLKGIIRSDNSSKYKGPNRKTAEMVIDILQTMHDQGFEILNEGLLVYIQENVSSESPEADEAPDSRRTDHNDIFDLPSLPMIPIQQRLHALIVSLELPPFMDVSRTRLMDLYAQLGHWKEFFDIFRMAPSQGQLQSPAVYACMFNSVARTGSQKACIAVLRALTPGLDSATPIDELDAEVGEAVRACLRIADPFIERHVISSEKPSEWSSFWKRATNLSGGKKDLFLYE